MESAGSDRPEQKTTLGGRKLDRYKVEIAALSENRLAEEGLLKEVGINDRLMPYLARGMQQL